MHDLYHAGVVMASNLIPVEVFTPKMTHEDPTQPWLQIYPGYTEEQVISLCISVSSLVRYLDKLQQSNSRIKVGLSPLLLSFRVTMILISIVAALARQGREQDDPLLLASLDDVNVMLHFMAELDPQDISQKSGDLRTWAKDWIIDMMEMCERYEEPSREAVARVISARLGTSD
jgi:hypothetical protein